MITDIALRSHQRTVHQDWSIYLRAARCAESSARANVRSQLRRWWNDGVQCDCKFRVSLAKPQNASAVTVCRVGLSTLLP